ncbi:hypothetical protein KCU81_g3034, partial [Aureobasidium melanogenum]|uniref:C2H2-type domain-containing protein n=1 Tax=Aureobasidium melanogenum (strain CBS 110374) TaxID=1043003 RepID=A0A074VE94_AURM1
MPFFFPCAICGSTLPSTTFAYQKHMTQCHWSGKNNNTNTFPLPSIFTTSPMPSPVASATYSCFFCNFELANVNELASHLIVSHSSDLHSILCPKATDAFLRVEIAEFLNQFAATGASFVSLCYCFPGHPIHFTNYLDWTETDGTETETEIAADEIADSGLGGSPMSTGSPADGLAAENSNLFALPGGSAPSLDGKSASAMSVSADNKSGSDPASSSNITPKIAEFLVSIGLTPTRSTSGKRVYLRPVMP